MSGIAFVLEAWKNADLAAWCVANVRRAYPEGRIAIFSDGDPDPAYRAIAEKNGAELAYGERLWTMGNAGPLWRRRLSWFLSSPGPYLAKIDTDTGIYRPFRALPEGDCIFGTVWKDAWGGPFVTGGFVGLTRGAAEAIAASDILEGPELRGFNNPKADPPMNAEDRALGEVAARLGIRLADHPEVASRWKVRAPNADLKYAAVHPCKDGRL